METPRECVYRLIVGGGDDVKVKHVLLDGATTSVSSKTVCDGDNRRREHLQHEELSYFWSLCKVLSDAGRDNEMSL